MNRLVLCIATSTINKLHTKLLLPFKYCQLHVPDTICYAQNHLGKIYSAIYFHFVKCDRL